MPQRVSKTALFPVLGQPSRSVFGYISLPSFYTTVVVVVVVVVVNNSALVTGMFNGHVMCVPSDLSTF
jgi:hypothetical protein